MEANWTDPFVFAIYSIVKPVAGSLILVFMYLVITGGDTQTLFFSYMFIGNALYMYVAEVLFGLGLVASRRATDMAIGIAEQYGLGAVAVRNSSHFGAAG